MRILIFHGYLLGGTGSNVYNARVADALVGLGHEVHLLSQERHPEQHPFVDAAGDWDRGHLHVAELRAGAREHRPSSHGRCVAYRPDIGGLLPVYVADRYEGIEARTFADCSDAEIEHYIDANVAAAHELVALVEPEIALANHLVMGPVILARALAGAVPYAVKVHGSALEYTVKPQPERFLGFAREGLASASAVLVGSHHTAASLWRALGEERLRERTRLGPPGVDIKQFLPREPAAASAGLAELTEHLREQAATSEARKAPDEDAAIAGEHEARPGEEAASTGAGAAARAGAESRPDAFARDASSAAAALAALRPGEDRLVAFVGKLIVSKGVDLLLACWPLVLERVPRARLVIVGFGAYREGLERLQAALVAGDLAAAIEIARAGRALEQEGAAAQPLSHLLAFLEGLAGEERESYLASARALEERVVFSGRLDHEELAELLPACEALVVPSTFPEAFGMVAAEGAACGLLPVSAAHSGLAEVSDALAAAIPEQAARWLSFPLDDHAVAALAECLAGWLGAAPALRAQTRSGLVATVRRRWSWEGVAAGVIAAARGELGVLQEP